MDNVTHLLLVAVAEPQVEWSENKAAVTEIGPQLALEGSISMIKSNIFFSIVPHSLHIICKGVKLS